MPHRAEYPRIVSQILALAALFTLEDVIFAPIAGVCMSLTLPFVVALGICEGPYMGAFFGAAAGLLTDAGKNYAFGVSALFLMIVGMTAGLVIGYFRRTPLTALVFTLASAIFVYVLEWFFLYYIWHGAGAFFPAVPLEVLYATVFSVPVYLIVHALSRRFGNLRGR